MLTEPSGTVSGAVKVHGASLSLQPDGGPEDAPTLAPKPIATDPPGAIVPFQLSLRTT